MSGIDGPLRRSGAVTIPQPPYPVDGNGSFSNLQLAAIVLLSPWLLFKFIPFFSISLFSWSYLLFWLPITGVPATVGYWYIMSRIGGAKREAALKLLPNRPMSYYFTFKDAKLKSQYESKKIPMQTLYDAYFDQKVDFNRKWSASFSPCVILDSPLPCFVRRYSRNDGSASRLGYFCLYLGAILRRLYALPSRCHNAHQQPR